MGLFLMETKWKGNNRTKQAWEERLAQLETDLDSVQSDLIEVQIAQNLEQAYVIVETDNIKQATKVVEKMNLQVELQKEVRLIGESLEDVKRQSGLVNYLVEWNLPEHLTMEAYLERKEKNSVKYEEVPEVSFARTYVCEDMTKCLCLYDAPNQEAVEKARKVVEAPIDAITRLDE